MPLDLIGIVCCPLAIWVIKLYFEIELPALTDELPVASN